MQKINLNGKEALVIDVDKHGKRFTIAYDNHLWYQYNKFNTWHTRVVELPPGKYSILGTITNGVHDFDVSSYIESLNTYSSPTQYFISLLHSQNIDTKWKKVMVVKSLQ